MNDLVLTLPGESLVGARIPRPQLQSELRLRLAMALYADGILAGAAACRMAGVDKVVFQFRLGERGICQPLDAHDVESDLENFAQWQRES